jgi:hypothetical protein
MINHLIEGIERVKEALQQEPAFYDAEIVTILLHRTLERATEGIGPSLDVSILATRYAYEDGVSKVLQQYVVTLRFEQIRGFKLEEFNHQNVIQELVVDPLEGGLKVRFASHFGAEMEFTCARAEVLAIATINEAGESV